MLYVMTAEYHFENILYLFGPCLQTSMCTDQKTQGIPLRASACIGRSGSEACLWGSGVVGPVSLSGWCGPAQLFPSLYPVSGRDECCPIITYWS